MEVLRIFILLFSCGTISCHIWISEGGTKTLSKTDVREINRIAEEKMQREMRKSSTDEDKPESFVGPTTITRFVEQTPPNPHAEVTTPAIDEIKTIRRNISDSGTVECNITAQYLWDLCRPVLLRSCKHQYLTQCRSRARHGLPWFSNKLGSMFPQFRPPQLPIFHPKPLLQWFDDEVVKLNDSDHFQFSISITTGNDTQVFTNENLGREIANITGRFQSALERLREKYRNRFRKFHLSDSHHGSRWLFSDDDEDDGDSESVEVPAERVESSAAKSGRDNPSYIQPKKRSTMMKPDRQSRTKRHGRYRGSGGASPYRRPNRGMPRPPHRTMGTSPGWMSQRFRTNRFPSFMQHRPRWSPHPWNRGSDNSQFWQGGARMLSPHRGMGRFWPMPQRPQPNIPPHLPSWIRPRNGNRDNDEGEDDRTESGVDFTCTELEENPEVCIEIAERTKKCENELERVCPKYVVARRRIKEQLGNIFSSQHQISEVVSQDGEEGENYRTDEQYQWSTQLNHGKRPIVIESIKIKSRGTGDAVVTAKLFEKVQTTLRIPSSDFRASDSQSLGAAIGKLAFENYMGNFFRHP